MGSNKHYFEQHGKEVNIKGFLEIIKTRLWIILLVMVLTGLTGYFYNSMSNQPLYETSTRIIIGSDNDYMNTLIVMIKDPLIMEKVKKELKLSRTPSAIASQVETARIDDSQVIMISVIDKDPSLAVEIANTTAKVFKNEVGNILDFDDVQLLSEAIENPYPFNENQNRIIILASIFGLITGLGFVFLLDALDDTIKSEGEVEDILGVPVLGVIPNIKKKKFLVKQNKQKNVNVRGDAVGIE